jgi:hypothetical protein
MLTFVLALLTLPPVQFKLLFDCIIWGMKHTLRDISDAGLMSKSCRIGIWIPL